MIWWFLLGLFLGFEAWAGEARVAVAANFAPTLRELVPVFQRETGHRLRISQGASGQLFAQIVNGAPFEVFLSADQDRPARLQRRGLVAPQGRFTYAVGRLVLWSPEAGRVRGPEALSEGRLRRLAIANPKTAPYGAAARFTLEALGLWTALRPRLVMGQNVAQAFQFVHARQAELGFVSLAQVQGRGGSFWLVPEAVHPPLAQDVVLLQGAGAAARALFEFLRSPAARARIQAAGYEVPEG